jgi:NAD-dependent DNA ligase
LEHQSPEAVPIKGHIVFSGVRDKVLEGELLTKGWIIDDAVSKKTTVLVVSDDYKETGKVKKAREAGISIKTLSAFRAQV